jgi:hypothetical protein
VKRRFTDHVRKIPYSDEFPASIKHPLNTKLEWLQKEEWTYIKRGFYPTFVYNDILMEVLAARERMKCNCCGNSHRPSRENYAEYYPEAKVVRRK